MKNGAVTFIRYNAETSIDLTMYSASLEADLHWSVATSPGDSDHCPILVTYEEVQATQDNAGSTQWNMKAAQLEIY